MLYKFEGAVSSLEKPRVPNVVRDKMHSPFMIWKAEDPEGGGLKAATPSDSVA